MERLRGGQKENGWREGGTREGKGEGEGKVNRNGGTGTGENRGKGKRGRRGKKIFYVFWFL